MAAQEQSVLIVHPDPVLRAGLVAALAPRLIVAVSSQDDAARTLAERAPDVVLADAMDARRFIQQLERLAPRALRVFLCPKSQLEALKNLVDVSAQGQEFHTVDPTAPVEEMLRSLHELLRQRASVRLPAEGLEASFSVDGQPLRAQCLNVGNEGFLLKLPLDAPIEKLPPGTRLIDLKLEREGRAVLRTGGGFVRHIGLERTPTEAYFRLGVQTERVGASVGYVELATLDDTARILGVLRRALRHEGLLQCMLVQGVRRREVLKASLVEDAQGSYPVLHCELPSLWAAAAGEVVQVIFDLGAKSYHGWTAVLRVGERGLALSLPRSLSVYHRRSAMRFSEGDEQLFSLSFMSPLTGERIEHPVLDMHAMGLSFIYDAAREVFPTGLLIDGFTLVLPDGTRAPCSAEVIDNVPLLDQMAGGLARPFRCGLRLLNVQPEAHQAVMNAFVQARCPQVMDGADEPFRNIWEIVRTVRHVYPDYPFEDGPHLDVLADTQRKLATSDGRLARCFVYRDGPQLIGHASGLRTHSRTWMLQHLMVLPSVRRGESISRDLSALSVDYAESLEDVDYVRVYWRIQNKWPDRVFGWISRSMHIDGLTTLRMLNYMRLELNGPPSPRPRLLQVRPAVQADLEWIEAHLRARDEQVRLLADDLRASEVRMTALGERYAAHGLRRGRSIFVVDGEHAPLAVALAEDASPGLSWPEMNNAFCFLVDDPHHPRIREAREALTARCIEHAWEHGKRSALALVQDDEVETLVSMGFGSFGRVSEHTFHRSTARTWQMLMAAVFERLQNRAMRHAQQEQEEEEDSAA